MKTTITSEKVARAQEEARRRLAEKKAARAEKAAKTTTPTPTPSSSPVPPPSLAPAATFEASDLALALALAAKATSPRAPLPILRNLDLTFDPAPVPLVLRVTGTDLTMTVVALARSDPTSAPAWALTVEAKVLASTVARMSGPVTLAPVPDRLGGGLEVKSSRSRAQVNSLPHEEFPSVSTTSPVARGDVNFKVLADAVSHVASHTIDDAQTFASTVRFSSILEDALLLDATDCRRLASNVVEVEVARSVAHAPLPQVLGRSGVLIPAAMLEDAVSIGAASVKRWGDKSVEPGEATVGLGFSAETNDSSGANGLILYFPDVEVRIHAIDASFPNVTKVSPDPDAAAFRVRFPLAALESAVAAASAYATEQNHPGHVRLLVLEPDGDDLFGPGPASVAVEASTPGVGRMSSRARVVDRAPAGSNFPGDAWEGESASWLHVNAAYLLAILRSLKPYGDAVELAVNDTGRQIVVRSVAWRDGSWGEAGDVVGGSCGDGVWRPSSTLMPIRPGAALVKT